MYTIARSIFAWPLPFRRKCCVKFTFEDHWESSIPKAASCLASGFTDGAMPPASSMPSLLLKLNEVGFGPPFGMSSPYKCHPCPTMARIVTTPSVLDVIFTDMRHFTGCTVWAMAAVAAMVIMISNVSIFFIVRYIRRWFAYIPITPWLHYCWTVRLSDMQSYENLTDKDVRIFKNKLNVFLLVV